ncbi:MAG: hypothetical protein ACYCO3_04520 [Mycobacteriales bacterium]
MSNPEPVSAEIAQLLEHSAPCKGWAEQEEGPYHRDTDTIFATGGTPAVLDITRSANAYRAVICLVLPSPTELR